MPYNHLDTHTLAAVPSVTHGIGQDRGSDISLVVSVQLFGSLDSTHILNIEPLIMDALEAGSKGRVQA